MALTKSFKDLVQRRVADDAAFGEALLREGIDTMLAKNVDAGTAILRDYIERPLASKSSARRRTRRRRA